MKRDEAHLVTVCCSVLQCVAVCGSVWQCVAVCGSELQYAAPCCSVWQCVAVCGSVWQCVAVCCSMLQCVTRSHAWCGAGRVFEQVSHDIIWQFGAKWACSTRTVYLPHVQKCQKKSRKSTSLDNLAQNRLAVCVLFICHMCTNVVTFFIRQKKHGM